MQPQRGRSVMAPLILAAVVVFAWGMAAAVLPAESHAAPTGPTGGIFESAMGGTVYAFAEKSG
ncbi:MAG: hypothetical protein WCB19_10895 [Thermoplasmata archaeon]